LYPNPAIDKRIEEERLSRFVELLRAGGTLVEIDENMQVRKWEKCVWNAAWNSLTALTMLDTHSWLRSSPEAMSVSRRLMREMISIARACQVAVASDLEDSLIEKVLSIPPIISSMQVDVKAGRLLEVEIIFGNPLRIAREHGLDVPTLELIYALLTGINGRQLQSCP
jgi:2-dehydropantoate 2-reductase